MCSKCVFPGRVQRCQSHHMYPYIWLSCKLKQWTGCAISSGVLFQSVFETQLFDISTFFDSLKSTTILCVCRNAIPQKFHQMLWAVKHGLKSDGRNEELRNNRGWLCENLANKKELKSASVSFVNFEKKACKILNYKNH